MPNSLPAKLSSPLLIFVLICGLLGTLILGYWLSGTLLTDQPLLRQAQARPTIELQHGTLYPASYPALPEFDLLDHQAQPFNKQRFMGKWSIVFFGYTHCPDVCPMTMQQLQQIASALDTTIPSEAVQYIFISVDPERDQDKLKDYISYFNNRFIAATGTDEQLAILTRSLSTNYQKHAANDGSENYLITHSGALFFINPQAQMHTLFSAPLKISPIASDIEQLYTTALR